MLTFLIVGMVPKKWDGTLTNAQACRDKRMYCYTDSQQKAAIVFNIFGQVLRPPVIIMPSENQEGETQESLLASAYKHWEDVKHFDDENSLEEHLVGLTNSRGPICSQMQNLPTCCDFNPNREYSLDYYNLTSHFTTDDLGSHNHFTPHRRSNSLDLGFLWYFDSIPIHEPNAHEHIIDAATPASVGLQDVRNRRPPKGWNIFWCIWRWRSVSKKIISKRSTVS